MRPVVVVEDRGSFGPALIERLAMFGVRARWVAHPVALRIDAERWAGAELVLLDALDLSSQQDDHTRSRLTALDLFETLCRVPAAARPRVVVYSTHMRSPEVHIPLRAPGVADAFYTLDALLAHLGEVVLGDHRHQMTPPSAADWQRLHPDLAPGTDVAAVHQRMRRNERVWEQVWRSDARFDRAAQQWVHRNVLPLLGARARRYRVAVDVTRLIAGLPYTGA